jgi:cytosine/adenosine deaminase-related metal-dependent hydrolase
MRTRITAGYLVGFNGREHEVWRGGELVYEDATIVFVGRGFEGTVDHEIDARRALVIPGLIDLHGDCHLPTERLWHDVEVGRHAAEGFEGRVYDPKHPSPLTRDDIRDATRFALSAKLLAGTTTLSVSSETVFTNRGDDPLEARTSADTAAYLGLRAYVAHQSGPEPRAWDTAVAFAREHQGTHGDRIRSFIFAPRGAVASADGFRQARRAATEMGVPLKIELAGRAWEAAFTRSGGASVVEYLLGLGMLGPDVQLAHALHIAGQGGDPETERRDLAVLADHGVSVIHCPGSLRGHGRALQSFSRYRRAGITLALGSTPSGDLIEEMRWAALSNKIVDHDPTAGSVREVFEAATLGGARALGRDDLGRLAPGARADITVVDLSRVLVGLVDDPVKALVHYATSADVRTVVVDGRTVVGDGRVVGVDHRDLLRRADAVMLKMRDAMDAWRAGGQDRP